MSSELDLLVGHWDLEAAFQGAPPSDVRGRVVFEWLAGEKFLVQRWEVPLPEAPDGIAVIGFDEERGVYLQHYFDSRGVKRIYEMSLEGGVWKLWRTSPDFGPLDFMQRFEATFDDARDEIRGNWEASEDEGASWKHDFELIYRRAR